MKKLSCIILFVLFINTSFATLTTPTQLSPNFNSVNNEPNVILDWSATTGATAYEYKLSINANLNGILSQTISGASQVSTSNLYFGTTYYWQVRAIKTTAPIDSSAWSSIWNFTTLDQLGLLSPLNGAINLEPNILLDWSGIAGISNYDYEWDTVSTFTSPQHYYASVGAVSQVNSANLRFGTKYFWRVRARHAADTTQWSAVWNFTTLDQLGLLSPLNGAINLEPNILLDWSGIAGITNYDYEWDTVSTFNSPHYYSASVGAVSQVNSSNLRFGTKYFWRVRARHAADTSQWSAIWNFTTLDQVGLLSPLNGAINLEPNILLDWLGIAGITNYDYEWDTAETFNSSLYYTASVAAISQVNTSNLRFGTKYFWRIRARHAADTTQWSTVWNFITLDQLGLLTPSNASLNLEPNTLLDWSGIAGISNYDYEWDTVSSFNSSQYYYASIGATSQVNTSNLRFGTKYFWRVRARHAADTTEWSAVWYFTTIDYLNHLSPANNSFGVSLSPVLDWTGISGILGYEYRYSEYSNFSNASQFSIGAISQATLSGIGYGFQYYWQVRAFHATDTSEWSLPWNFTSQYQMTQAPTLISPVNNSINIPVTGTSLQWTSANGATLYEYQIDDNPLFTSPLSHSVLALTDTSGALLANTIYYWRVRAANNTGYSPWSLTWSFNSENTTGISSMAPLADFMLYPNPAKDRILLKFILLQPFLEIYNLQGNLVYQARINGPLTELDLSQFSKGLYFLRLSENEKTYLKRITIE